MGNIVNTIKRFLGNKNTVTILAVIAGVIILWYFYNSRVNAAITTIRIPYAIEAIDMGSKIEADNIGWKEITKTTTKDSDIVTTMAELTDKYVNRGTSIPAGGFFYKSQISDKLPGSYTKDIPEGQTKYNLAVDSKEVGNSIVPGDYIDLYVRFIDQDDKVVWGPLINSIKVQAVLDSQNREVGYDSKAGTVSTLVFFVTDDYNRILMGAESVKEYKFEFIPVVRGKSYTESPGATEWGSQSLYDLIDSLIQELA